MIVAWTGHRPELFRDALAARAAVDAAARDLLDGGATCFHVGGQRGVDTWAALAAVRLRVPFAVFLPADVDEFTRGWTATDRAELVRTLALAGEVQIARGYTERNRLLATGTDLLVAVWTGIAGGGTAETVEFARQAATPIREVLLEASATAHSARGRGI